MGRCLKMKTPTKMMITLKMAHRSPKMTWMTPKILILKRMAPEMGVPEDVVGPSRAFF